MKKTQKRIIDLLKRLYGVQTANQIWIQLEGMIADFIERQSLIDTKDSLQCLSEKDAVLITYGDQFKGKGLPPLSNLLDFYQTYLVEIINTVHILPFFPYSSDDGFAVVDYYQVDPNLGSWDDIVALKQDCNLMFDAVINHISSQSDWFQDFLRWELPYRDYFICADPETDLSGVVRPRTQPLLTSVETAEGTRHVWTTFSADQVDLNYANPAVLLEIIAVLFFYIEKGAKIIRLDAIAFLWKELGTSCIHLPETHLVIKLIRAVLDLAAPGVLLISETNVPHDENISYFGSLLPETEQAEIGIGRGDEAQLVYQFPLAPLVLHTFLTANASKLSIWAAGLELPYPSAIFLNFIASHDGIGVRPVEGILTPEEVQAMVEQTIAHSGLVSYKTNPDGSQSVYELNICLFDALNNPAKPTPALDVQRFLASQVIMLSLAGVPGIYVHCLLGSGNCQVCVQESGRSRSINRQKFQVNTLETRLDDPDSTTGQVFDGYERLLHVRRKHSAFHPLGAQRVINIHDQVFAILRTSPDEMEQVLCLVNVSGSKLTLHFDPLDWGLDLHNPGPDLVTGERVVLQGVILLQPYQYCWMLLE